MKRIVSKPPRMNFVEVPFYRIFTDTIGLNCLPDQNNKNANTIKIQQEETTMNTNISNKQKCLAIISGVLSGSLSAGSLGAILGGPSGMAIGGVLGAILGGMFILLMVINAGRDKTEY